MLVAQRTCTKVASLPKTAKSASRTCRAAGLVTIAAAISVAGCSANITRLDAPPSFALGEGAKTANPNTSSRRTADTPFNDGPSNTYASTPRASSNVEVAGLPPLTEPSSPPIRAMAVTRQPAAPQAAAPQTAAPQTAAPAPGAKGQLIEVQQGDTLYAIGKRHNVMISDLMAVNELKSPNLKPGQKLYLPGNGRNTAAVAKAQRPSQPPVAASPVAPATIAQAPTATPAPPAAQLTASNAPSSTYTVKQGDSLYAIAAKNKVKLGDLQRANDITDATKVKPGMVLKIPGANGTATAAAPAEPAAAPTPEPRIVRSGPQPAPAVAAAGAPAAGLKVLNGDAPRQVAAVEPATRTDAPPMATTPAAAAPVAAAAAGKLRWPVKGRVVQSFGPRPDGSHNDGVDIAVPAGTDVLAAEGGVVAYAGNEVKTYGNLVLIRHDNGWVTAYAYNEKILVGRGDRVKRGQPIAKAGKTGGADQPQLHFEVRVGSKPVDPTGYLEKL